jgi:hypothetical protein
MKLLAALWILTALPTTAWAEQTRPQTPKDATAVLGEGWSALGAQQPARAIEAARRLLKADPGDHNALALEVAALTVPSQAQPMQALDAYERWLNVSKREDIFLLQPVAMSLLRQLAQSRNHASVCSRSRRLPRMAMRMQRRRCSPDRRTGRPGGDRRLARPGRRSSRDCSTRKAGGRWWDS